MTLTTLPEILIPQLYYFVLVASKSVFSGYPRVWEIQFPARGVFYFVAETRGKLHCKVGI
jgi:hypothetical protein